MPAPRALFVIPSLRGGGAERVFTLLLNGLSQQGFDMHVALCQCEGYWLERLAPAVTVHDLKSPRVRQAGWPIARLVRSLRPATVLSTSSHLNTVIGLFRPLFPRRTRLLLRDVNAQHLEPSQLKGFRGSLLRRAYRSADSVICLVDSMRPLVADTLGLSSDRIIRIFNPVDRIAEVVQASPLRNTNPRGKDIISIGSLNHWKGFDRLIDAIPALLKRFPESTLTILGEGDERASLETRINQLQLADRVRMPGFSSNVRSAFDAADLFVLASRFEGMPNVLLEAIDARCPFVTTDHPGGTREVLELLGQQHRITADLSEWRDDWFAPFSTETHQAARTHFSLDEILKQYASALFNPSPRHVIQPTQESPLRGEGGRRPDEGTNNNRQRAA
jgi:glycosyltransferase involved in cell wall biosynthesis